MMETWQGRQTWRTTDCRKLKAPLIKKTKKPAPQKICTFVNAMYTHTHTPSHTPSHGNTGESEKRSEGTGPLLTAHTYPPGRELAGREMPITKLAPCPECYRARAPPRAATFRERATSTSAYLHYYLTFDSDDFSLRSGVVDFCSLTTLCSRIVEGANLLS